MRSLLALRETLGRSSDLPPAPQLGGHVFTELAVDDVSGPALAGTLTALGFIHIGQHRSKPVSLWQQGEARVLLNSTPRPQASRGSAAISALAVHSADPAGSAQRAQRLLAPLLSRARQPSEAELASVAAPDGTAIFFCGNDSWLGDFTPTGVAADGPLTGTDHVSLTEPFDEFDQSALFYRTVLGLRPEPATELTAPFGLIRSRAASDSAQQVLIRMNAALLRRRDWAPAVPSPQHIAFRTDDALAAARTLRARGAPLLDIPANYYDDLDARLAIDPDLLAALREYSVLYDRDAHGEYLHFYTGIFGSRVFFEVVQRIGGYAGYGSATSAPVRMAAHRQRRLLTHTGRAYSLAHLTALNLSPPELIDAAAAAGYRYVGLRLTRVTPDEPHYPLTTNPALLRETKSRLAATGIGVLDIELARIGPLDDPHDFLPFLETGAELGARHVITQLPDPDFNRKTSNFALLCDLAKPLGLTIDLEFPSWTETPNLTEAVRVLRAVQRSNAGILVDLLHFARSDSSLSELRGLPPEWFHYAHVCDAPPGIPPSREELIHTARRERLFPGEGGIDVPAVLAALPPDIPYALEIPHTVRARELGPTEYVRRVITTTREHLDRVLTPRPLSRL
jgi:4-hydroxyphenylpyruvate dioxygenase-like putative hemolysin/sugar phosphate isomerase/epimerase